MLRYRETVIENGKPTWKDVTAKLAPFGGEYRTEASVRHLAEEKLAAINSKRSVPNPQMPCSTFSNTSTCPIAERRSVPARRIATPSIADS